MTGFVLEIRRSPSLAAIQRTAHGCVAAAMATALGDLFRWDFEACLRAQESLRLTLGGLDLRGADFDAGRVAGESLFGREAARAMKSPVCVRFDIVRGVTWEDMIVQTVRRVGLVIALAPRGGSKQLRADWRS